MISVEVRKLNHGSQDYRRAVDLRRKILRIPLGLDFSEEELTAESDSFHLGMWEGERLIGCLVLVPRALGEVKMRQVAVDDHRQGQGLGRKLVEASEEVAREIGGRTMTLHAREAAVPFYEKLGYSCEGDAFVEVGVPHRRMVKQISKTKN